MVVDPSMRTRRRPVLLGAVFHPDVAAAAQAYHARKAEEERKASETVDEPDAIQVDAVPAALTYQMKSPL